MIVLGLLAVAFTSCTDKAQLDRALAEKAALQAELEKMRLQGDELKPELVRLREEIASLKKELDRVNGEFDEYKRKYVLSQRSKAKGEIIGPVELTDGRTLAAGTKILGFSGQRVSLQQDSRLFTIELAILPEDLRNRFLFTSDKPAAGASPAVSRYEHIEANTLAKAQEQLQLVRTAIAEKERRIAENETQQRLLAEKRSQAFEMKLKHNALISDIEHYLRYPKIATNPLAGRSLGLNGPSGELARLQSEVKNIENAILKSEQLDATLESNKQLMQSELRDLEGGAKYELERKISQLQSDLDDVRRAKMQGLKEDAIQSASQ